MVKSLIFFISIFTLWLLMGCDRINQFWDQPTAEDNVRMANVTYEAIRDSAFSNPSDKHKVLEEIVRLDPSHHKAYLTLARNYLNTGQYSKWKEYYDKALFIAPISYQASRGYALLYTFRDYNKALADFDAMDNITPNSIDYPNQVSVDYLRGLCYMQLKENTKALEYFDKYIREETAIVGEKYIYESAHLYKGIIFNKVKSYRTAIAEFKKGLKIESRLADLYYHMAVSHLYLGDYQEATVQLKEAEKHFYEGDYHRMRWGRYEEFEQLYEDDLVELRRAINRAIKS